MTEEELKEKVPTIWKILFDSAFMQPKPIECCDCLFGKAMYTEDGPDYPFGHPPNPSDPGEGYYECSFLGEKRIWGEQPVCTDGQWIRRAREEIQLLSM